MKMCLFPSYRTRRFAESESPTVFRILEEQGVPIEDEQWMGTIESLPHEPALIRASSMLEFRLEEFARRATALGHFCFYQDHVGMPDGQYRHDVLVSELLKFLEKNGFTLLQ